MVHYKQMQNVSIGKFNKVIGVVKLFECPHEYAERDRVFALEPVKYGEIYGSIATVEHADPTQSSSNWHGHLKTAWA